jgi:hypothetical protein
MSIIARLIAVAASMDRIARIRIALTVALGAESIPQRLTICNAELCVYALKLQYVLLRQWDASDLRCDERGAGMSREGEERKEFVQRVIRHCLIVADCIASPSS